MTDNSNIRHKIYMEKNLEDVSKIKMEMKYMKAYKQLIENV